MRFWLKIMAKAAVWYLGVAGTLAFLTYAAATFPGMFLVGFFVVIFIVAGFAFVATLVYEHETKGEEMSQAERQQKCSHRVIRRKRSDDHPQYAFDAYVCGQCDQIFEIKEYHAPEPPKDEPMFDKRPWGFRERQA